MRIKEVFSLIEYFLGVALAVYAVLLVSQDKLQLGVTVWILSDTVFIQGYLKAIRDKLEVKKEEI